MAGQVPNVELCLVRRPPVTLAPQDVVTILRAKGHTVPEPSAAAAIYSARCHRCRTAFTTCRRKVRRQASPVQSKHICWQETDLKKVYLKKIIFFCESFKVKKKLN